MKNYQLEPFEKEHLYHVVKLSNQSKTFFNLRNKKKTTIAEQTAKQHSNLYVATHNRNFIGFLELVDIDSVNQNCLFNIAIEEEKHLEGVLDVSIVYCFDKLALSKISTVIFTTEQKMISLLRQRHFSSEVRWRQHIYLDGNYCSMQEFSLLTEDYEPVNAD